MKTLCLVLLLSLVGCTTTTVTVTKNVAVTIPDELLVDCPEVVPPPKNVLVSGGIDAAEQREYDMNMKHEANLKACNKRLAAARDWQAKAKAAINNPPDPTK